MQASDVSVLQGVCNSHFDRHVLPLIQSLQENQIELGAHLDKLSARVEKASVERAAAIEPVHALGRLEQLLAKMEQRAKAELTADSSDLDALMEGAVSSATAKHVIQDEEATPLEEQVAAMETLDAVGTLAASLTRHVIPLLDNVQQSEARGSARLEELGARIEKAALIETVPTITQFEELSTEVSQKVALMSAALTDVRWRIEMKADSISDSAVMAEPTAHVESAAELQERIAAIECEFVRTLTSVEALALEVKQKAGVREVPTFAQFQKLALAMESKADSSKVPTITQFQELTASVTKMKADVAAARSAREASRCHMFTPRTSKLGAYMQECTKLQQGRSRSIPELPPMVADAADAKKAKVAELKEFYERQGQKMSL